VNTETAPKYTMRRLTPPGLGESCAVAAQAAALIGHLSMEEKTEEALQSYSQLTDIVGDISSEIDILSIDQLRRLARSFDPPH
jgi:hypothetical protein